MLQFFQENVVNAIWPRVPTEPRQNLLETEVRHEITVTLFIFFFVISFSCIILLYLVNSFRSFFFCLLSILAFSKLEIFDWFFFFLLWIASVLRGFFFFCCRPTVSYVPLIIQSPYEISHNSFLSLEKSLAIFLSFLFQYFFVLILVSICYPSWFFLTSFFHIW